MKSVHIFLFSVLFFKEQHNVVNLALNMQAFNYSVIIKHYYRAVCTEYNVMYSSSHRMFVYTFVFKVFIAHREDKTAITDKLKTRDVTFLPFLCETTTCNELSVTPQRRINSSEIAPSYTHLTSSVSVWMGDRLSVPSNADNLTIHSLYK